MSWICPRCETENPDVINICEVCNSVRSRTLPQVSAKLEQLELNARYYIKGRPNSIWGYEMVSSYLPKGTLIRKMLTDKWIPIEYIEIPIPQISYSSYYYSSFASS